MIKPIFVFSLPRSGSTLLQRMLGSSSAISTVSEPWLLLPLCYTRLNKGVFTEYSHLNSSNAVNDFILNLPQGEDDYNKELHDFVLRLYNKASSEKSIYFLDKTPRYHLIVDEIIKIFPDAKFIFLWRHPLSIVSSIMNTWAQGKWNLYAFKIDLYKGIENLVDASIKYKEISYCVKYEDLVTRPEKTIKDIFSYLDICDDYSVSSDIHVTKLDGIMGDPTGIRKYQNISSESLNTWKLKLNNPLRKAWSRRYLKWIGGDNLSAQGYSINTILNDINDSRFTLKYILTDIFRIAYGFLYCGMDIRFFKYKLKSFRYWKSVYFHN